MRDLQSLRNRIKQHCARVQPGLEWNSAELSLEEVFAAFELVLDDPNASTRDERRAAERALRDLSEGVRIATFVYGRGDARKFLPHDRNGVSSSYAELLETLYPRRGAPVPSVFITMNYDINLDRCLIRLRRATQRIVDLDYGLLLANARCATAPLFDEPRPRAAVLLRLHGGLNWVRCGACHSMFTTVNRHATVRAADACWSCGRETLGYVIVHPSFLRTYSDPVIRLVWGRARSELSDADRWIFIGYSLPDADVHLRELLRECLRRRRALNKATEVVFVGRDPGHVNVAERYSRLFGTRLTVWRATPAGFSDFVSRSEP